MSSNIEIRSVVYQIDGQPYESRLVYDTKLLLHSRVC